MIIWIQFSWTFQMNDSEWTKLFSLHIKLENVPRNPSRFFKFSIGNLISTNFTNSRAIASWISIVINFSLIKILRKCIGLDFHDVLQSCLNVSPPIESPIDQSRFTLNICCPRNADSIFEMFRMLVVNSFYEHIFRKHVYITCYCIKRTISTSEIKLMTR